MKAGFKTVDITPNIGVPMGGNCRDDITSRGVHDSLNADIIVLESYDDMLVLIDVDWCEAPLEVIRNIKKEIASQTGIDYSRICLTMTHTHSSPETWVYFKKYYMDECQKEYLDITAKNIIKAIKEALATLDEVLIGVGRGYEDKLSFNRRVLFKDGSLHMNWEILENPDVTPEQIDNPEGPIDPDLYVVKICDKNEKLKAVLVNFTLHPAVLVMQDWLFSKDYIWAMEEELKKTYGQDVLVYFANGAEGNINHINMWNKCQKRGWEEAYRIGSILGSGVKEQVEMIKVKEINELKVNFECIHIPAREISEKEIEKAQNLWDKCKGVVPGLTDGVPPEWYAGNILKIVKEGLKTREAELYTIKIGDIIIATLPGEVFVEFGLEIKEKSPYSNTLVFGLANQSIGYIPTERAFVNGGYEPVTAEFSILVPEAGNIIVDKILNMISDI